MQGSPRAGAAVSWCIGIPRHDGNNGNGKHASDDGNGVSQNAAPPELSRDLQFLSPSVVCFWILLVGFKVQKFGEVRSWIADTPN